MAGQKIKLSEEERAKIKKAIESDTPEATARRWNMNDTTLLRAAMGYPVQRGTKALIEIGLAKDDSK